MAGTIYDFLSETIEHDLSSRAPMADQVSSSKKGSSELFGNSRVGFAQL